MTLRGAAIPTSLAWVLIVAMSSREGQARAGRPVSFASTDGTTLAALLYESFNRPAPAVVLVHMLGRSKDEWGGFADALQDAGATVLALDLRGHGSSGGDGSMLPQMVGDVRAAVDWLSLRPSVRPRSVALVGASLGANLVAHAALEARAVRGIAMVSPSQDYRGIRVDVALMKKLADRSVWMAASLEDPYALRTVRELSAQNSSVEQQLSGVRAHGTLLLQDEGLRRALVDWLRRTLIF